MPAVKEPKIPQIIVMAPSPESWELVNFVPKITLKQDPKPMKHPSSRPKAAIKRTKSLFLITVPSTFNILTCSCFFRLTKLGASLGPVLMTRANPTAITVTKTHCCKSNFYKSSSITESGVGLGGLSVTPKKTRPVCKNASRLPAGTESAPSVITKSLYESGNHLFGIRVVAQT